MKASKILRIVHPAILLKSFKYQARRYMFVGGYTSLAGEVKPEDYKLAVPP